MRTRLVANKSLNLPRGSKDTYITELLETQLGQLSRNLLIQNIAEGDRDGENHFII
jgi:hypothetical protein